MRAKNTKRATKRRVIKRSGEATEYSERGIEVWDMTAVERNHKRAAKQVLALLDSEIVPLWLRESLEDAIQEAARRKANIDGFMVVRRSLSGEYLGAEKDPRAVELLTNLFELTPGKTFTLRLSDREKLARAISEILNNKTSPVDLYNPVGEFTTQITVALLDNSPEVIEKALAKSAAQAEV